MLPMSFDTALEEEEFAFTYVNTLYSTDQLIKWANCDNTMELFRKASKRELTAANVVQGSYCCEEIKLVLISSGT